MIKQTVGVIELCALPELDIKQLHVRVDTGAKTSSLHVDNITETTEKNEHYVSFDIHPDYHNVDYILRRKAKIKAQRKIKSSNGEVERRYVINTELTMGDQTWPIELTLTDRSGMTYLMLLGRQAMKGRLIVDPEMRYLLGEEAPQRTQPN